MSVLLYKNKVKFDSFLVEPNPSDTVFVDLNETAPPQKISNKEYYGASIYMCGDCIRKYSIPSVW